MNREQRIEAAMLAAASKWDAAFGTWPYPPNEEQPEPKWSKRKAVPAYTPNYTIARAWRPGKGRLS